MGGDTDTYIERMSLVYIDMLLWRYIYIEREKVYRATMDIYIYIERERKYTERHTAIKRDV